MPRLQAFVSESTYAALRATWEARRAARRVNKGVGVPQAVMDQAMARNARGESLQSVNTWIQEQKAKLLGPMPTMDGVIEDVLSAGLDALRSKSANEPQPIAHKHAKTTHK